MPQGTSPCGRVPFPVPDARRNDAFPSEDPLFPPKARFTRKHKRRWRNCFRQRLCFRWHEYRPFVHKCQGILSRFYVFHNVDVPCTAKVWQMFFAVISFLQPLRPWHWPGGGRPPSPSAAAGSSWRAARRWLPAARRIPDSAAGRSWRSRPTSEIPARWSGRCSFHDGSRGGR